MNIAIIFATRMGTTKYVATTVQNLLQKTGHQVKLHNLNNDGLTPDLTGQGLLIFAAPTYESGEIETTMSEFMAGFSGDLSNYKLAVIGLGDSTFPKFCEAASVLENWLKSKGGSLLTANLKIDGYPHSTAQIETWVQELTSILT